MHTPCSSSPKETIGEESTLTCSVLVTSARSLADTFASSLDTSVLEDFTTLSIGGALLHPSNR